MEKLVYISCFLIIGLMVSSGCTNSSTENTTVETTIEDVISGEVTEESYSRENTKEEQQYINLLLNEDYETLLSQTEAKTNKVQSVILNRLGLLD